MLKLPGALDLVSRTVLECGWNLEMNEVGIDCIIACTWYP